MKPDVLQALCADLAREFAGRLNDGGGAEPLGFVLVLTGVPVVHVAVASNLPTRPAAVALGLAAEHLK